MTARRRCACARSMPCWQSEGFVSSTGKSFGVERGRGHAGPLKSRLDEMGRNAVANTYDRLRVPRRAGMALDAAPVQLGRCLPRKGDARRETLLLAWPQAAWR